MEGRCVICGAETRYRGEKRGYDRTCSRSCSNLDRKNRGLYNHKYSKLFLTKIIPEYEAGALKSHLAKKYNLKIDTITNYFIRLGVKERNLSDSCKISRAKNPIFKYSCNWDNVYADYLNNVSKSEISKRYNIKECSICSGLKARGYKLKSKLQADQARSKNGAAHLRKINLDWLALYDEHLSNKSISEISKSIGVSESVIGRRFKSIGKNAILRTGKPSQAEIRLFKELSSITKVKRNCKNIIGARREVDLLLPEHSLAIEYNGSYFHSNKFVKKTHHLDKTRDCLKKGIKLIHIWDDKPLDIAISRLKSMMNVFEVKLGARLCSVKINDPRVNTFFRNNHLDGTTPHIFSVALEYKNEIVSSLSIRRNNDDLEIARFANKLNHLIMHGFERLMSHAIDVAKKQYSCRRIITYADIDWTPDYKSSVYSKYGMKYLGETHLKLFYFYKGRVHSRHKFQKHKLAELFPESYCETKTADEILTENNVLAIYRNGNHKFELILT